MNLVPELKNNQPLKSEIIPDQTTKIRYAKIAQAVCLGAIALQAAAIFFQIYQDPSLLNPWSESFIQLNANMTWGYNMILLSPLILSTCGETLSRGIITQATKLQSLREKQLSQESQNLKKA